MELNSDIRRKYWNTIPIFGVNFGIRWRLFEYF